MPSPLASPQKKKANIVNLRAPDQTNRVILREASFWKHYQEYLEEKEEELQT